VPAIPVDSSPVHRAARLQVGPHAGRHARGETITQDDLKRLLLLAEQKRKAAAEYQAARDEILHRHLADSPVESGRLALCVRETPPHLTEELLKRLLGEEKVQELKRHVTPKLNHNVRVTETE
jgi:hypothetical protein